MSWQGEAAEGPLANKEVHDAVDNQQSEVLEFLPSLPDEEFKVAKKAVEFANHKGGSIFLGIDNQGDFKGLSNIQDVKIRVGTILEDRVEGDLRYYLFIYSISNDDILELRIKEFRDLPCAVDGQFFTWKPAVSRPLSPDEVRTLFRNTN